MTKSTTVSSLEDCIKACKLGIEALKCIQRLRKYEYFGYPTDLPGETPPE